MTKVLNRSLKVNGKVEASAIENTAGAATAAAGAVTLNATAGKITTEALTTAQNAIYTLTITNNKIDTGSIVLVTVANGTNTQGTIQLARVQAANGSAVLDIHNKHASAVAFNGNLIVSFLVINPNVPLT